MCASIDCTSWSDVDPFLRDEAKLEQRHKYGCKLIQNHTDSLKCTWLLVVKYTLPGIHFKQKTRVKENAKTTQKHLNHVTKCIKMFCIYNIYVRNNHR